MGGGNSMTVTEYLILVSPLFGTILVVFAMKYFAAIFQARARSANDATYRTLAERAVAAQTDNQATLAALGTQLARVAASLAAVEKILQQID